VQQAAHAHCDICCLQSYLAKYGKKMLTPVLISSAFQGTFTNRFVLPSIKTIVLLLLLFIINTFLFYVQGMIALTVIKDYSRQNYLMTQLGQMLAVTKDERLSTEKILPTLNILDPISLQAWIKIRSCAREYGKHWMNRHGVFMGFIFLTMLFNITYDIVLIFDVIQYRDYRKPALVSLVSFDFAVWLILVVVALAQLSKVNEAARIHQMQIWHNQSIIKDLHTFRGKYFKKYFEQQSLRTHEEVFMRSSTAQPDGRHSSQLDDPVFIQLAEISAKIWPDGERLTIGLQHMIKFYEQLYSTVKYEDEYEPAKLLGLKVTKKTFASISALVVSLIIIALDGITSSDHSHMKN
jgi:ABC-type multidrug transport system fused ATPase/permease subunit